MATKRTTRGKRSRPSTRTLTQQEYALIELRRRRLEQKKITQLSKQLERAIERADAGLLGLFLVLQDRVSTHNAAAFGTSSPRERAKETNLEDAWQERERREETASL